MLEIGKIISDYICHHKILRNNEESVNQIYSKMDYISEHFVIRK